MTELTNTGSEGGSITVGEHTVGAGAGAGAATPAVTQTPALVDPALLPETLRAAPSMAKFMQDGRLNAGKLAESYRNLEALQGVPPDQLIRFPQNDGDWDKVYNRLGRPEKPDGYKIEKAPEEFKKMAHEMGLTQKQAETFWNKASTQSEQTKAAANARRMETKQAHETQLKSEWGAQFDRNADIAHRAAMQLGGEELMKLIEQVPMVGSHPALVRAFLKVGQMLGESSMLTAGSGGGNGGVSPAAAQAQIKALGNDKAFTEQLFNPRHEKHKEAKDRWDSLHKAAYPDIG